MSKDWIGNKAAVFSTVGSRKFAEADREQNDFYATEPKAVELLLEKETFNKKIWEPACGKGHISDVLKQYGYDVKSTDLIDRGYGLGGVDFFTQSLFGTDKWSGDIVTNPPYKYALDFTKHALEIIPEGNKVAMFLKLQFLEGTSRWNFFRDNPPKTIYVSTKRLMCAMNGDFENLKYTSAVCYCWYIWIKGFNGEPTLRWINTK